MPSFASSGQLKFFVRPCRIKPNIELNSIFINQFILYIHLQTILALAVKMANEWLYSCGEKHPVVFMHQVSYRNDLYSIKRTEKLFPKHVQQKGKSPVSDFPDVQLCFPYKKKDPPGMQRNVH